MSREKTPLSKLARLGFAELQAARAGLAEFPEVAPELFGVAASPDLAIRGLGRLRDRDAARLEGLLADQGLAARLIRVIGASEGLLDFLLRHPDQLDLLDGIGGLPPTVDQYRAVLLASVAGLSGEPAWNALRVAYRGQLLRLAAWDLEQPDGVEAVPMVAAALADLAGAALDASLDAARRSSRLGERERALTRLAIIGMGKAGARELNYLSDVDVIFVAATADPDEMDEARAVQVATSLATETIRGISALALEPALWEVDANLRPEGKDGALVRSLASHLAYYERWAKGWEFQALLKARPLAGDAELGAEYLEHIAPLVWSSAAREGFVESVQRMRVRVTEHIPTDEVDIQLKLGPGGLRDIEFTVQLLQLVHGLADSTVRRPATLDALAALSEAGYIGRVESAEFSSDYRFLRLLEHRIQLSRLRRSHLMPREEEALRQLARATGVASTAKGLVDAWQRTKTAVRGLHERLFYRPLLSAVAALPDSATSLTSEQAADRMAAIGFQDPQGALRHIAALTEGVSRRARVQRALLPVLLQWFSEGADPDYGLLAFRRMSDELGDAYWYLRLLRDSNVAAHRLTQVLSSSRYVGGLFESIPDAAAWLEDDAELRPRSAAALLEESAATAARYAEDVAAGAKALRTARRREVLRLALASILGIITIEELGHALSDVATALLSGVLGLVRHEGPGIEFAIIGMGRYGGRELGFGSDLDVMYVYRPTDAAPDDAQRQAEAIIREVQRLTEDIRLPFDLDIDLRPEGRNGARVRSLESYRAYYERWSLTWEAQALLRARGAVGDAALIASFEALADRIRYPAQVAESQLREVRRIKARVESERLPQGADPARHLKLGRGSLSDVEWYVQLIQLREAARIPELRTTSTLAALAAALAEGFITPGEEERLRRAWVVASRARSALTLWSAKTADVLPTDRSALDGVARLMGYPPGSASRLEEDYLRTTRIARQVFERGFYRSMGAPRR